MDDFLAAHLGIDEKIVVVDSAEHLLSLENTDPLREFVTGLLGSGWKVWLTTRNNYLNDLAFQFIEVYQCGYETISLTPLNLKELSELTKIRNILGLRTAFNTVEKLLNPGNSKYAINAAFHKPYVVKYNELFGKNYEHLVIIKGNEGTPEIFSKCKYWLNNDGQISEHLIEPEFFGINYKKSTSIISKEESLNMTKNPSDDLEKLAKLNAAMFLIASKKSTDIKEDYTNLLRTLSS